MKIAIVGLGKYGTLLTEQLSKENLVDISELEENNQEPIQNEEEKGKGAK